MEPRKILTGNLPDVLTAKWGQAVLDEGFVPFPKRLLRCLSQVFSEANALERLAAVLAIVDYRRPHLSRPPSIEYLAFNAGLEIEAFRARIDELKAAGFVVVSGSDDAYDVNIDGLLSEIERRTPSKG